MKLTKINCYNLSFFHKNSNATNINKKNIGKHIPTRVNTLMKTTEKAILTTTITYQFYCFLTQKVIYPIPPYNGHGLEEVIY